MNVADCRLAAAGESEREKEREPPSGLARITAIDFSKMISSIFQCSVFREKKDEPRLFLSVLIPLTAAEFNQGVSGVGGRASLTAAVGC